MTLAFNNSAESAVLIEATNFDRQKVSLSPIKIKLFANAIPSLNGAKNLFKSGYESSLAPNNRAYLKLLTSEQNSSSVIDLIYQI